MSDTYIIKNGGPVFDGLEAKASRKQETGPNTRVGGVWLDVKVHAKAKAARIWFSLSEVVRKS